MSHAGRVALITGGRRVGSDLARDLAERGVAVALTYHTSRSTIEQTVSELEQRGGQGLAISADLTRSQDAERTIAEVVGHYGRIDYVINMASIYRKTPFDQLTAGDFDAMVAANLAAPYHVSVYAARQMRSQRAVDGIQGRIVSVGDWASDRPYKHYLPYLVAKGGLKTLTLALAKELAPTILVNLVQPAMIEPPPDFNEADQERVIGLTPLRRCGTPADLNRLILYLLEGNSFVTGSCFRVDGGRFLGTDMD